jgi:molybdate transport system substrate-binding protein
MLPAELQQITIYSGGVTTSAKEPAAAKAFLEHIAGPAAAPVYKAKGLSF